MKKTKIAFLETEAWEADYLKSRLKGFELLFLEGALTAKHLAQLQDASIISPFIYSPIRQKELKSLPALRLITTRSTGYDHIDLKACAARGITVANVPTYGDNTVAEHAFALILALSRKICFSYEQTRRGNFSLEGARGFDLEGKTIGIVGLGNIGKHMVRMARGFGMNILVFDIRHDSRVAKKLGFSYASWKEVLGRSDIISLHLPYNKKTHHLINIKTLPLIKKGACLINTARGGVCDTTALLKGLKEGVFGGLGLDVLEEETAIKEERQLLSAVYRNHESLKTLWESHILINQPNVIITPHNAFNSHEALTRILETTVDNITAFARRRPINVVK